MGGVYISKEDNGKNNVIHTPGSPGIKLMNRVYVLHRSITLDQGALLVVETSMQSFLQTGFIK